MATSISIQELLSGKSVASSRLNDSLVQELIREQLLMPIVQGARKSYRARDVEALRLYLEGKDERYRLQEIDAERTRASMASGTGNSKLVSVRSCPGFMVNTYEPIRCRLHGAEFVVAPMEGTMVFVSDWEQFDIPADVLVVGIENMENFRMIRKQRDLFDNEIHRTKTDASNAVSESSVPMLFVSRYPQSNDLRKWLMRIPNRYIHYGDFDLAGVHIFLTEFHRYLGERSSYLIPSDVESRLQNGSDARYNEQLSRFRHVSSDIQELNHLISLIHKYRKGYDQEGYIHLEKNDKHA